MEEYRRSVQEGEAVFVGVDLHRLKWHVTVRTEDEELFSGTVPGQWQALQRLLDRYRNYWIQVVYEAGYYGFWLYDRLVAYGAAVLLRRRVFCLRSMEIGSRQTGATVGSLRIFWPKGC